MISAIMHLRHPEDISEIHADIRNLVAHSGIRNLCKTCLGVVEDIAQGLK